MVDFVLVAVVRQEEEEEKEQVNGASFRNREYGQRGRTKRGPRSTKEMDETRTGSHVRVA
jgi:hypothetical protein